MKKLTEGRLEIFTTKEDAIEKLMQIQGISREHMTSGNCFQFLCYKDGKIYLVHPPERGRNSDNSTVLFGQVIEQDGKTYVSYYTEFRCAAHIVKYVTLFIHVLIAIACVAITIITREKLAVLLSFLFFGFSLFLFVTQTNDRPSTPIDSEILVKELEKRVEAVNQWDK